MCKVDTMLLPLDLHIYTCRGAGATVQGEDTIVQVEKKKKNAKTTRQTSSL